MDPIPGFEEHTTDSIGRITNDKEDEKKIGGNKEGSFTGNIERKPGAKQKAGNENKDKKEMDDIMAMIGSLQIKSTQNPK
ncbi:hypothetical protein GCK72_008897 [Caenorhabditis remanei]|uniref:Uncharacterized protein n=1 Tax=Caenorhabditis remanei TaxID=31234 RepID=A0A6A5GYT9_CAERE|nr:hypothetical protein GCK72_008897 [Caenorhabditis remanei]KAF1760648.1 hypothetical protein GCK72_008897 [Caenorhabditis remanei]